MILTFLHALAPSVVVGSMALSMALPPISSRGTIDGSIFQYSEDPPLVAFESRSSVEGVLPPNKCILVGGLSDGLLPVPYTESLTMACQEIGWSVVQPLISSSYLGFGSGSLSRDTKELSSLLRYLKAHRSGERFAIIGHSTGCQDSVHFLKHGDEDLIRHLKVVALQAPCSDREGPDLLPDYGPNVELGRKMVEEGNGEEMMPRRCFWAPITASRFLALLDKFGDDDFFSSDFTDEEFADRLGHVGKVDGLRVLVAYSGKDEYVPEHVDKDHLLRRMCEAMNSGAKSGNVVALPLMLEHGNHNLSQGKDDAKVFVDAVIEQLRNCV